jgi:hypothetical protein
MFFGNFWPSNSKKSFEFANCEKCMVEMFHYAFMFANGIPFKKRFYTKKKKTKKVSLLGEKNQTIF